MAVFTTETDYPSETDNPSLKSVKIDEKQMDKVRQIVHQKLRQLYYLMRNFCNLIGSEQWYFRLI